MSIRKYNAFIKVVETGSITKAAALLGHTQSSVTQLLNALEEDLGHKLLIRNRTGITLTEEGRALLPYIEDVVKKDELLSEEARRLKTPPYKTIRVGAFTSVAVSWLPAIFRAYQKIDSTVRFEVVDCGYNELEEMILRMRADFAFAPLPLSVKCRTNPLLQDELLAIVPKNHPLSKQKSCPLTAFETEDVISLVPAIDRDARSVYEAGGIIPNTRYTVEDDYALIAMVGKGLGISIVPKLMLDTNRNRDIAALPLDPHSYRTIGLVYPQNTPLRPEVEQFTSFIKEWIQNQ